MSQGSPPKQLTEPTTPVAPSREFQDTPTTDSRPSSEVLDATTTVPTPPPEFLNTTTTPPPGCWDGGKFYQVTTGFLPVLKHNAKTTAVW